MLRRPTALVLSVAMFALAGLAPVAPAGAATPSLQPTPPSTLTGTTSATTPTTPALAPTSPKRTAGLPNTGLRLPLVAITGAVLLGLGVLLRARPGAHRRRAA
jgi:hypothetical protein